MAWTIVVVMLGLAFWLYKDLNKEKMPPLTKRDMLLHVDWNEKVTIGENDRRVQLALRSIGSLSDHNTCLIGEQQFLLDHGTASGFSQADIYFSVHDPGQLSPAMEEIGDFLRRSFPSAIYSFEDAGNIFSLLFAERQAPLLVRLRATGDFGPYYNTYLQQTIDELARLVPGRCRRWPGRTRSS